MKREFSPLFRENHSSRNEENKKNFLFQESPRLSHNKDPHSIKNYYLSRTISKNTYNTISNLKAYSSRDRKRFLFKEIENLCPGGQHCKNYKALQELINIIEKLTFSNDQLTEINNYFCSSLNHKDNLYLNLLKDHVKIKSSYNLLNFHLKSKSDSKFKEINNKIQIENEATPKIKNKKNSKKNDIKIMINSNLDKSNEISKKIIKFPKKENLKFHSSSNLNIKKKIKFLPENERTKTVILSQSPILNLLNKKFDADTITTTPFLHYKTIDSYTKKNQYITSMSTSFLSFPPDKLEEMSTNPILKELYSYAQREDQFIDSLNSLRKEKIYIFCEVICSVTREYKELIKLVSRIKEFLKSSIKLVDSVLIANSTNIFITNTCNILNCEKAFLFIYDKMSDMLIMETAETSKNKTIKVPKDEGIIGKVFLKGEKMVIEDVYRDKRFNRQIDKQSNFKLRNMLCFPLKDKDSNTFGVIQALNKTSGQFDSVDLELIEIFSEQASSILKTKMNLDEYEFMLSRMKIIFDFSNSLLQIDNKVDLIQKGEEVLHSLFFTFVAKIYFCNKHKEILEHWTKGGIEEVKPLGILGYVLKNKIIYACKSVKNSDLFNNLVDIYCDNSLLTIPVIKDSEIIAIIQSGYQGDISNASHKPKDKDIVLIDFFNQCLLNWYSQYE